MLAGLLSFFALLLSGNLSPCPLQHLENLHSLACLHFLQIQVSNNQGGVLLMYQYALLFHLPFHIIERLFGRILIIQNNLYFKVWWLATFNSSSLLTPTLGKIAYKNIQVQHRYRWGICYSALRKLTNQK